MEPGTRLVVIEDMPSGANLKIDDIIVFEETFYIDGFGSSIWVVDENGGYWLIDKSAVRPLTQKDVMLA